MHFKARAYFQQLPVKWQLLIGLSALGTAVIATIGSATIAYDLSKIRERVEESSRRQTELVAKLSVNALIVKDRPVLQTIVDGLRSLDTGLVKIELSNQDGLTLASWEHPAIGQKVIANSEKIIYHGHDFGTLSMAWTYDHFAGPIFAVKVRSMLITWAAFACFIIALGGILQWYLVGPLEYLEEKVRAVANNSSLPKPRHTLISRELRSLDQSLDQTAQVLIDKAQADAKVLTERSRAETAEAAAKAKMEFLSLMSHEIRTPLGAMIGFGRLLKTAKLDHEERGILDNLNASGRFLLRIINDILDLSKIEANGIELDTRQIQTVVLLDELEEMVRPLAEEKGLRLDFRCDGLDGKGIAADPHRLKQILMNLIGNAVKFTEEGDVNVLATATDFGNDASGQDTATIQFEVSDTGIGMSEAQCANIFDPFSQADSGVTRRFGGTGLGLSIASQLAAKMGGQIEVTSEVGVGSSFVFEAVFPVSDALEVARRKPQENVEYTADTDLRILIAEDESVNRILVEKIFASIGHEVEFAEDGQICVDRLREGIDFDAIFLDLHMPRIGGFEIARMLRSGEFGDAGKSVNLVMMSADVLAEKEGYEIGIDAFISKPINPDLLGSFLRSISSDAISPTVEPAKENRAPAILAAPSEDAEDDGMSVLVVEDQKLYRELMSQLLRRIGLNVSFAKDGIECLQFLEEEPELDAIFLDLRMPRMDGVTVAKMIRDGGVGESYTDIPIAIVSAEYLATTDFEEIGIDDFIAKPVDFEHLREFVAGVKHSHSLAAAAS